MSTADPPRPVPLLICSIGNPGVVYANTFHSAGHNVVSRLAANLSAPSFRKEREFGNGLVSGVGDWTLWQSPGYMNECGAGVRAAWVAFNKTLAVGEEGRLIVVHDELEGGLGTFTIKEKQGLSAKGHNGLKSILAVSKSANMPFVRIGVGIGRPKSRDPEDVAKYVLSKMTEEERLAVEGCAEKMVKHLQKLQIVNVG